MLADLTPKYSNIIKSIASILFLSLLSCKESSKPDTCLCTIADMEILAWNESKVNYKIGQGGLDARVEVAPVKDFASGSLFFSGRMVDSFVVITNRSIEGRYQDEFVQRFNACLKLFCANYISTCKRIGVETESTRQLYEKLRKDFLIDCPIKILNKEDSIGKPRDTIKKIIMKDENIEKKKDTHIVNLPPPIGKTQFEFDVVGSKVTSVQVNGKQAILQHGSQKGHLVILVDSGYNEIKVFNGDILIHKDSYNITKPGQTLTLEFGEFYFR